MAKTNLTFTKGTDGRYSCEFSISDATALHVERSGYGPISIGQKSSDDSSEHYATVKDWHMDGQFIIDVDLVASVYPKYIKVTTITPVDSAYIMTV